MPASGTAPPRLLRRPRRTFYSSVERKRANHDSMMGKPTVHIMEQHWFIFLFAVRLLSSPRSTGLHWTAAGALLWDPPLCSSFHLGPRCPQRCPPARTWCSCFQGHASFLPVEISPVKERRTYIAYPAFTIIVHNSIQGNDDSHNQNSGRPPRLLMMSTFGAAELRSNMWSAGIMTNSHYEGEWFVTSGEVGSFHLVKETTPKNSYN